MKSTMPKARTLGELKQSGYQPLSLREEMRKNLIAVLESGTTLLPEIVGYEDSVVPQIENAILAGHDMILLGERGQGKTRIIRALVGLLDEWVPIIRGSEVNDSPFAPISRYGQDLLAAHGDKLEIAWLHRSERYGEKLATPDTTTAELIGEVDPVKVAEGRYLSDELTIHYGLIPRTNRGVFAINELPDLPEKVQVSLFNVLEERDIQIKGYRLRLPLDMLVVATANPEDYTSRGRIITPLKDRYSAHIRTHYPKEREVEVSIIDQECARFERRGRPLIVPSFMKDIIAEITFQARGSADVNQVSGVSVRMSINNLESLISNAEKRAIRNREPEIVPRLSDLEAILATTDGKLEMEYGG
ncbi:MAG TPA: AAA family ATPase, partial [bacterium]|nr:AAA family ATPase [bacterium]